MWTSARLLLPVLLALLVGCSSTASGSEFEGLQLDPPTSMPAVVLNDLDGQPFDMVADTAGQVRLVYFGYTNCPDVCPIHLSQLRDVLARPGMPDNVAVIFVTVDPARDTPQVIRSYLDQFSSDFIGLTGTDAQLVAAQQAFGSVVAVRESDDDDYTMGHDGRVFAFTPSGLGLTTYPHPTRQSSWVHDIPLLATTETAP
jgi:protein SCO1/2